MTDLDSPPAPPIMNMDGIVCARCDLPLPQGSVYAQLWLAPELVVIVCPAHGEDL